MPAIPRVPTALPVLCFAAWRVTDGLDPDDPGHVVRWNPLEGNLRLYTVVEGCE